MAAISRNSPARSRLIECMISTYSKYEVVNSERRTSSIETSFMRIRCRSKSSGPSKKGNLISRGFSGFGNILGTSMLLCSPSMASKLIFRSKKGENYSSTLSGCSESLGIPRSFCTWSDTLLSSCAFL